MHKILLHPQFKHIMMRQIRDVLNFLIHNHVSFNMLCDLKLTSFNPPLPKHITSKFDDITMFIIAGYTLESFTVENDFLTFEAGFGSEGIGSVVKVAYFGIVQIILRDNKIMRDIPLFTNVAHPYLSNIPKEEAEQIKQAYAECLEHSKLALASNPENSRFFKKTR